MESLNERISELEQLFDDYKTKTDLKIKDLEEKLKEKEVNKKEIKQSNCMIKEALDITIVKHKKSILVKSTYTYNTTQPYKELFKDLEGKWMKSGDICGWIYPGKCPDDSLEKNSQFIIDRIKENDIEYSVIYN